MTPFRIIHISDTHLGAAHPWITANFEAMADIIARQRPDLVINTGSRRASRS
jgi:3',5'-cyclic AMP phosphodiesterase CpdA